VVALSAFMDDTTRRADLVLPIQVDVERFNAGEAPHAVRPVLNLSRPTVRPRGEARHPGDVLLGLATALDRAQNLPWSSFPEMAQALAEAAADRLPGGGAGPFRPVWEEGLDRGGLWDADADPRPLAEGSEPLPQPASPPPANDAFDLVLFESAKIGDGRGANRPWLQELPDTLSTVMWGSWIEVSASDAERLGIRDGDVVELKSQHGVVEAPAISTPAARPGTVGVPLGLGHIDFGRYARGRGINPLDLLGPETIAGTTASRLGGTQVELRRVGPGRVAMFGRGLRDGEEIPTGWAPQPAPLNTDPEEEA
jgi:anaerobic selenocysteine-containing dehydrogenase